MLCNIDRTSDSNQKWNGIIQSRLLEFSNPVPCDFASTDSSELIYHTGLVTLCVRNLTEKQSSVNMSEFPNGVWIPKYAENKIKRLYNDDVSVYVTENGAPSMA
jgi:hypothetical protein